MSENNVVYFNNKKNIKANESEKKDYYASLNYISMEYLGSLDDNKFNLQSLLTKLNQLDKNHNSVKMIDGENKFMSLLNKSARFFRLIFAKLTILTPRNDALR